MSIETFRKENLTFKNVSFSFQIIIALLEYMFPKKDGNFHILSAQLNKLKKDFLQKCDLPNELCNDCPTPEDCSRYGCQWSKY